MDLGYFQKQTCFVSCFLEVDVFCFLTLPHFSLIDIRALTYLVWWLTYETVTILVTNNLASIT